MQRLTLGGARREGVINAQSVCGHYSCCHRRQRRGARAWRVSGAGRLTHCQCDACVPVAAAASYRSFSSQSSRALNSGHQNGGK